MTYKTYGELCREMSPAYDGVTWDFSKLPKEETVTIGEDKQRGLQNKGYVNEFLEDRIETTVEKTKPREKNYVLRSSMGFDGWIDHNELDQLEKEIEEERRKDEEDEFEDWLNEGYFLSGWRT